MKPGDFIAQAQLAYAFGGPCISGIVKQKPEDFRVIEIPGFEPDSQGDHVFLTITKESMTTNQVARKLQHFCKVHPRDIGYAGLKDKHAITTQSFSINLSGKAEPDWSLFENEQLRIEKISRHPRKLKKGVLKGNRFELLVRNVEGDFDCIEKRLTDISHLGVPNYFGSQRFGLEGSNIEQAWQLLNNPDKRMKRDERSILLSSVRSMIFNAILDERVKQGNWNQLLKGEVVNLDGTERHFHEPVDDVLKRRSEELDVHPTAALAGKPSRAIEPTEDAADIENAVLLKYQDWIDKLKELGLEHARRPVRIAVRNLCWELDQQDLKLSFDLTSGAYATVVLRELLVET